MSELCREQHPLLVDEHSDEDVHVSSYNYKRRSRPSVCRGRVRNYAKGATAVISRWPDNCSTSVAYWWIGAVMITLSIFIIYNSVLIFGMMPPSNLKLHKYKTFNSAVNPKVQLLSLPNVYMHLVINNITEVNFKRYLPHINIISKKYPSFKYKFLVVINDTTQDAHDFNDHQRNDMAFNSLWTHEEPKSKISKGYNISIEYMSLTGYLNDSPVKKVWRYLPSYLIDFLVRSISIWDKGGIAFNPTILTSKYPNPIYIDKLYDILNDYVTSSNEFLEMKPMFKVNSEINMKRPNNIQDILNDLDREDSNFSKVDLNVAENNEVVIATNTENILHSRLVRNIKNGSNRNSEENENTTENGVNSHEKNKTILKPINQTYATDNILPLFLKYLFNYHRKEELSANKSNVIELNVTKDNGILHKHLTNSRENKSMTIKKTFLRNYSEKHDEHESIKLNNFNKNSSDKNLYLSKSDNHVASDLSIDLKGNFIASKTACHAFLGTVFSNVIHHANENTLTDFIISELSLFCNGLLTSCAGINVILV